MKELAEYFRSLRHNANFHLGLGDVRLTLAMQEEVTAIASRVASQQMRAVDFACTCAEGAWLPIGGSCCERCGGLVPQNH